MRYFLLLLIAFSFSISTVQATHIRAGDLTIRRISETGLTYEVIVVLYLDVTGISAQKGFISFGYDNAEEEVDPISLGLTEDKATEVILYKTTHTFPSSGSYKVSYFEMNRNPTVTNIDTPGQNSFYIESEFLINPILGMNSSPTLLIPPVLQARIGQKYTINAGAYDAQGDSLSYRLTLCKQQKDVPVTNYRFPDDPNENWTKEREDCSIPGDFMIDPNTGDIVWDAPNEPGEYNVAFYVDEWRGGVRIGSVNRDMQIIVKDVLNLRPNLSIPMDTCIVAGNILQAPISAQDISERVCASGDRDPSIDSVSLSMVAGPVISPPGKNPVFNLSTAALPIGQAEGSVQWETNCLDIREEPYQFIFQALDHPEPNRPELNASLQLGDMKTWKVKVLGPAPQGITATPDQSNNSITLNWDNYTCDRAETIHIYRRRGSYNFEPVCETGVPDFTGYEKIAEVDATDTSYMDENLDRGTNYCYRIYVTFGGPQGGESLASAEACAFIPDVFYMTQVSVMETSNTNGSIQVSWTQPEASLVENQVVTYEVFRGLNDNLLDGESILQNTTDTTFIDSGLDTENQTYYYWATVYGNGTPLDTTQAASTVGVQVQPLEKEISLNWFSDTPWSISTTRFPIHYIYRKEIGKDDQFLLIDSVDITQNGLWYLDEGSEDHPLEDKVTYCYKILTQGSYDFDGLPEPLLNYSPEICSTLLDTIAPCPPVLSLLPYECKVDQETYLPTDDCKEIFKNSLTWEDSTGDSCEEDIQGYNIYYSSHRAESKDDMERIASVGKVNRFIHDNLSAVAGSYAITAVDEQGNESAISNIVMQDNPCTYYELPNAFTPNGDGINDVLIPLRCPLFAKAVVLTVTNRWGEVVYEYSGDINIEWDGKDVNGTDLPSATYYYHIKVHYYRLDPGDEEEDIKGWIQLMR
ncbi:gliding motility-associated C-terminal domain-containing protein [Algivirga pacifica]|uniref:Fibronectin type-III domain-containing protein n=1 Tax=Algivirga pacifica TaxID=1162670 RepID=A0ABP9DSI9_9BACT